MTRRSGCSDPLTSPAAAAGRRRADAVARQALMFSGPGRQARRALINGAAGVVAFAAGRPVSVMSFAVTGGRIAAIDALTDPARLAQVDLTALDDGG